jgi:CAAX protease family protein
MEVTTTDTTRPPARRRLQAFAEAVAVMLMFLGVSRLAELAGADTFRSAFGMAAAVVLATWLTRRQGGTWAGLGFKRPGKLWLAAVLTLVTVIAAFGSAVAATSFLAPALDLTSSDQAGLFFESGDFTGYLSFLLIMGWGSAAFGEELMMRGFIMNRFGDAFGGGRLALALAVVAQATIFGLAHYKLGGLGMLTAGVIGLVMGLMYYLGKRNLWHLILAHGIIDSISLTMLYLGVQH